MGEGWWEEMVDTAVDTSGHSRRVVHWGGGRYCEETAGTSGYSRRAAHWGEAGIAKRQMTLQTTFQTILKTQGQ